MLSLMSACGRYGFEEIACRENSAGCNSCALFEAVGSAGVTVDSVCEGIVLWLDASQFSQEENRVALWEDRSGRENHARQEMEDSMPTLHPSAANGIPAVVFSQGQHLTLGARYLYADAQQGGLSMFFVVQSERSESPATEEFLFDFGHYANRGYGLAYYQSGARMYLPDVRSITGEFASQSEFSILLLETLLGKTQTLFRNGSPVLEREIAALTELSVQNVFASPTRREDSGPVTLGHQSKLALDAERHFEGKIAEVLIYQKALEPNVREELLNYLSAKYGIPVVPPESLANGR